MPFLSALLLALATAAAASAPLIVDIRPAFATDAVDADPDDPAIWVNQRDPAKSLILGTNKTPAPSGALVVFGLDGRKIQTIGGIDRPNNVDVEYGLNLRGAPVDIGVLTERLQRRLRVFRIEAGKPLTDISSEGGIPVFAGVPGEAGAPMGIALYKRPRDGAIFAIVGRKTGPLQGYLAQYRLEDDGRGLVKGVKVREFGTFSGIGEIEAIAVDDELGYVYYADEGNGIHKWHADPDHPGAATELAHFGKQGFLADREGIALYTLSRGRGYILCTDQIEGNTEYKVYRREGKPGNPHDHSELIATLRGGADSTDGLEAGSLNFGAAFPKGMVIAMNSAGKNFLVYDWRDIAKASGQKLQSR
jgi:3-phytase